MEETINRGRDLSDLDPRGKRSERGGEIERKGESVISTGEVVNTLSRKRANQKPY